MIHVQRYFAALTTLLALFCTYSFAVVPWLEPPPIVKAPIPEVPPAPAAPSPELDQELARLFPPDHWVRQHPKRLDTEQCTLLIQDYRVLPDGRLELRPCTLIFHSGGSPSSASGTAPTARGRPIVLEAPKAELTLDRPLNLARAQFGRVEKGTLSGEITIYSPPSAPGAHDELRARTRAVWLDRQSIRTSNDVEFQYGDSTGRGRDLEITLLQDKRDAPRAARSKLGGIQTVLLKHLYFLRIATQGRGLLGDAIPTDGKNVAPQSPPLEVTCKGEFAFDVPAQLARFQEQVEVRQLIAGAPPDQLRCDELLLALGQKEKSSAGSTAEDTDPLAGRLRRIVAIGGPAVLQSPSRGVQAVAAFMEYSVADRSFTLKSDPRKQVNQASLRQFEQHFIAPELHYQMAEEGRLGRLQATGPGELRLLQGRGPAQQVVTARWQRELQIQPQGRNHVISLLDAARVAVDPLGRFDADELHLWVLELPAEKPPADTAPNTDQPPQQKTTIVPDRLLAIGNVRVASTQLDAETARLAAWFINLPPLPPSGLPPAAPPGRIREPVQPAAYVADTQPQAAIRGVIRPPAIQKFHVRGNEMQMQLLVRGRQFDLEDLNIDGQAAIDETCTPLPELEPIRVRGDLLAVRRGTQPEATIDISGKPAEVAGRGMSLRGGQIHVRRGENRLWIDGPGEATLPAGAGGRGTGVGDREVGHAQPAENVHVVWEQAMNFDGLKARFDGEVKIRTVTPTEARTAHTPALEAELSRRIDFQAGREQPRAELARVFLDGGAPGVYIEGRTFDEMGEQISAEQMKVRNLAINRLAGSLHAAGPGWVNTVRRGSAGLPGAAQPAPGATADLPSSATPRLDKPPLAAGVLADPQQLTSVHIEFEREMVGNEAGRWIEFRQQVQTTYSPALEFSDMIVADPLSGLRQRMVLMKSNRLRITELAASAIRSFEIEATDGATIEAEKIFVDAPIVRYASDKEVLVIEADGRAKARVSVQQATGRAAWGEGEKFRYNLRTGEFIPDSVNDLRFDLPPNTNSRLPKMSLPDPSKAKKRSTSRGPSQ